MRRGCDRVKGSIGRSYDEIKGVTMSVRRNFHMLSKITTGKKVENWIVCVSPRSSTWMLKSPVLRNS